MKLQLLNFYRLLRYDFHIPSFQRGYRWEKKQVVDLLDDLKDFYLYRKSSPFYCLQPIVVKKRGENSFDVLDGQQRLTTAYLILVYLKDTISEHIGADTSLFSLHFDTRDDYFFNHIDDDSDTYKRNIDFFFMHKAYENIKNWFSNNRQSKSEIAKMLAAPPEDGNDECHKDVRVIWYEVESGDESKTKSNSIDVFRRLNHGKIGLTDTELIKAMILQTDIYGTRREIMSQWAYKAAADWDYIERELQKPNFWAMLSSIDERPDSCISLILDFVAKYFVYHNDGTKYDKKYINPEFQGDSRITGDEDPRLTYKVFEIYLSDPTKFEGRVKSLWEHILDTFSILKDWYDDREIYHYIGLLNLPRFMNRKEKDNLLFKLFVEYMNDRKSFKAKLINKVGAAVKINSKEDNGNLKSLDSLKYGEDNDDIIRILELLNIDTMMKSDDDGARFNFAEFRKQNVTSLEHIHPQNLDENDLKYDDLLEWVKRKKGDCVNANKNFNKLNDDFEYFENIKDETDFKEKKTECMSHIHNIDNKFDELAGIGPKVMHSIRNLALIDKDTNAAMQNYLMDSKREVLKSRRDGHYIPIATWNVFNKFYTCGNVSDLKFWTAKDRDDYYDRIEKTYNSYTANVK